MFDIGRAIEFNRSFFVVKQYPTPNYYDTFILPKLKSEIEKNIFEYLEDMIYSYKDI